MTKQSKIKDDKHTPDLIFSLSVREYDDASKQFQCVNESYTFNDGGNSLTIVISVPYCECGFIGREYVFEFSQVNSEVVAYAFESAM